MQLKELFTYQNLFQINGAFIDPREKLILFLGGILVLLAIVLKIAGTLAPSPVDAKYRVKFYHLFLTIGLSELVWYGCRYQNIKFFGTHFVAWLIGLIGAIWLVMLVASIFKNFSKEKTIWEKEQVRLKYLPK